MTSRRAYRKPTKKVEISDQADKAFKATKYAFKAKAAREFKAKGIVSRKMARGWSSVITRSAKTPGAFQITRFDADMEPVGDTQRNTLSDATEVLFWDVMPRAKKVPVPKGVRAPAKVVRIGTRVLKV